VAGRESHGSFQNVRGAGMQVLPRFQAANENTLTCPLDPFNSLQTESQRNS
jgi:hypothetical protein